VTTLDNNNTEEHMVPRRTGERRVLVFGSIGWDDRRMTTEALRRVEAVYRPPYVLVADLTRGPGRYAAVVARELGWKVEPYVVEHACAATCPPGHARGVLGDRCPTAAHRALLTQIANAPDVVIVLSLAGRRPRENGQRLGQSAVRDAGLALWQYVSGNDRG
jgi:hypothetical protein